MHYCCRLKCWGLQAQNLSCATDAIPPCLVASTYFWTCHLTDRLCCFLIWLCFGQGISLFTKCLLTRRRKSDAIRILRTNTWRKSMSRKVWHFSPFFGENNKKSNSGKTKCFRMENILFLSRGSLTCQSFLGRIEVIMPMTYLYFGGSISFSHHLLVCTVNSPVWQNSKLM